METIHDPEDYASRPDSLPPGSFIGQALALGARFKLENEKWFACHPKMVTVGNTQVEAARDFLHRASGTRS